VTPFREDLSPDPDRWMALCRWLLSTGCGLAVFGTNSEANSLSVSERRSLLEHGIANGLDPARMMPGTGSCALPDAVELGSVATRAGCAGVLMLPPFYYRNVDEDGLFAFFSETIQRVGDDRLRVYLYHIPKVSGVAINPHLVERLLKAYPETIAGMKDSDGDQASTERMIANFPGFDVFCGSDPFLLATMRAGGAGCIAATANVNSKAIVQLYREWTSENADAMQEDVTAFRRGVEAFPMIPALKAIVSIEASDPGWARTRPPLVQLTDEKISELATWLRERRFQMEGLSAVMAADQA
jgi:4-hydroxy-tetrahydrodipicolinate synthase